MVIQFGYKQNRTRLHSSAYGPVVTVHARDTVTVEQQCPTTNVFGRAVKPKVNVLNIYLEKLFRGELGENKRD